LQEIEGIIQHEVTHRTRAGAIDLARLTAPRSSVGTLRKHAEDGFLLKGGWEKSFDRQPEIACVRHGILRLSGEAHALRDATVHRLVADAEVVSGGTTYTLTEITDPEINGPLIPSARMSPARSSTCWCRC